MFTWFWRFLGWPDPPPLPSPPPVTITGIRIPADGSRPRLVALTTISDPGATWDFLHHYPDVRRHWPTEQSWRRRDLFRLDLLEDDYIPLSKHLQQSRDMQELLSNRGRLDRQRMLQLNQRYRCDQRYYLLKKRQASCAGAYYVLYTFDLDNLPRNGSVPAWMRTTESGLINGCFGDVFVVKMAEEEHGEHGWARYEDISPHFLKLLVEEPLPFGQPKGNGANVGRR